MKIDLHLHTNGDDKRNINNEDLLLKLNENKVNIAAISDHNNFDLQKYNKLIKNNYDIKFIPAMEIDIKISDESDHKQIILYCEDVNYMQSLNKQDYPININDLLKTANSTGNKILLSFHFLKDEKRSFTLEQVIKIEKSFISLELNNIRIMLEAPNLQRASTIRDSKFHISSFSDLKDWSKYPESNLPSNKRNIDSLEKYIIELVNNKVNSSIEITDNKAFNLGDEFQNSSIFISHGLNIIFGSKGSGKTFLIDKFHENNPDFEKINFLSFNNIKKPKDLLDKWVKANNRNINVVHFIDTVNSMKTKSNITYEPIISTDFNFKTFKTNMNNFNKNSKIIRLLEKMSIVINKESINSTDIDNKYGNYKMINKRLLSVANVLSKENYEGNISKEEIINLLSKNIDNWKDYGLIFKQKRFVKKFRKSITEKFKINDRPKIGLEDKSGDWLNLAKANVKLFNSVINLINKSKKHIKLIQSDILGEEYGLEVIRKKRNKIKVENPIKNFTIGKDNDKNIIFFNEITKKKISKIINKYEVLEIKPSDIFDIDIISSFGKITNYIPSTGQLDMLYLDAALSGNNKNILIDEFCNSLDSKYIYENLVDKMNNYNGRILASTHNPVISVLPNIRNYIYTERNNSNYKTFQSNDYLSGDMKELNNEEKRNTKKMLIDVIEGTKKAFNLRGDKYGIK